MVPTAAVAGFFAGLFGIGGGLITVPFLFFIFDYLNIDNDYLMHLSVGTSFSITILTSLSSVLAHKKNKAFDFNIVFNYGIFVVVGVVIGTILTTFLNTKSLLLFFSVIVFFFGAYLLLKNETKQIKTNITFHWLFLRFWKYPEIFEGKSESENLSDMKWAPKKSLKTMVFEQKVLPTE